MATTTLLDIKRQYLYQRELAIAQFRTDLNTSSFLRDLRRITDLTITLILNDFPLPDHATLAAIGGYGRGELYPHSDIDLLILLDHRLSPEDEQKIHLLLNALWDIGLEISHSVRSIPHAVDDAAQDITLQTSLLEARLLRGNRRLLRQLKAALALKLNPQAFFIAKKVEMQHRHARYGNTPYALEPNCKESPGGLRDIQLISWMARAAGLGKTDKQLQEAGLLSQDETLQLEKARRAFERLRIELHLMTQRREDRVLFDLQNSLAKQYEFSPTHTKRPSEVLMQRYYWAAKLVTQLTTIILQQIEERLFPDDSPALPINNHFRNHQGRLDINDSKIFYTQPILILKTFYLLQQHPELDGLSARAMRALWHSRHIIDQSFRENTDIQDLFLDILKQDRGIVHEFRRMNELGILARYLPAFRHTIGQMQHDLFHVYTVDQHILTTLRNLRRFSMHEHIHEHPFCSELMLSFNDHWLLYIAALFHDIGKGRGGDHSEIGAQEVAKFSELHRLSEEHRELLVFLVTEHLSLSRTAQKQDLSDPHVIIHFTQIVKTKKRLNALYLLTVADIQATNPKLWNSWRAKLLDELYKKTVIQLEQINQDTEQEDNILARRRFQTIQLLQSTAINYQEIWEYLGDDYFFRYDPEDIAWHTTIIATCNGLKSPMVTTRVNTQIRTIEILVVTQDQADLFFRLSHYLFLNKLNILSAKAYTSPNKLILNTYIVQYENTYSSLEPVAEHIESTLSTYILGPTPSLLSMDEYQALSSRQSRSFPMKPIIELRHHEDMGQYVLSIQALDKPGLLYSIASVLYQHRLNVLSAKIMTLADRVEDTFLIQGNALLNATSRRNLEKDLFFKLNT